jgi:diamine N-acetyltransferase
MEKGYLTKKYIYKDGDGIRLRPINLNDFSLLLYWRSIEQNAKWFTIQNITYVEHWEWYGKYTHSSDDYTFVAETLDKGTPIGMVAIYHIDYTKNEAEFGRLLLAHPDYRGKGLGKEMTRLAINAAFNDLNLNRLYLEVLKHNPIAHNIYLDYGFKDTDDSGLVYKMELFNVR